MADPPLKTLRLKHVSAAIVTCEGGGEGNESVYAEAVPKGGPGMVAEYELDTARMAADVKNLLYEHRL